MRSMISRYLCRWLAGRWHFGSAASCSLLPLPRVCEWRSQYDAEANDPLKLARHRRAARLRAGAGVVHESTQAISRGLRGFRSAFRVRNGVVHMVTKKISSLIVNSHRLHLPDGGAKLLKSFNGFPELSRRLTHHASASSSSDTA